MGLKTTIGLAAAATCISLGALVPAVAAPAAHAPPAPLSGNWKLTSTDTTGAGPEITNGSMKVASGHRYVSKIAFDLGTGAETACGRGHVRVLGKPAIKQDKGDSAYGSYDLWAVGRNAPDSDPVVQPIKAALVVAGKHINGKLEISFVGATGHKKTGDSGVDILYRGGTCELQFDTRKA